MIRKKTELLSFKRHYIYQQGKNHNARSIATHALLAIWNYGTLSPYPIIPNHSVPILRGRIVPWRWWRVLNVRRGHYAHKVRGMLEVSVPDVCP